MRHPLVKKYIKYKWFTVGIPGLIFYFALYLVFLVFLTTFALLIPRPSVANSFCAGIFQLSSIQSYSVLDFLSLSLSLSLSLVITFLARTMNVTRNVTQMEVKGTHKTAHVMYNAHHFLVMTV